MAKKEMTIAYKQSWFTTVAKDFKRNKWIYLLAVPAVLWYIIFCYKPMYGVLIAFKDFKGKEGILGSAWVGLEHFKTFFDSIYFERTFMNTIILNAYGILFGFPIPIILALMMNELRNQKYKKLIQTTSYLPHFISLIVVCGMVLDFTSDHGFITSIVNSITGENYYKLLEKKEFYRVIYIASDIWQTAGWGSIIYLAALAGVDMSLYEAAKIDGAGKWKQLWHVTIPGIMPTIVIMFILKVGSLMSIGADKTILLYNELTYETSDIISSYVFRMGIGGGQYSLSAAVGLFNSVINCILVLSANALSKKFTDSGLF